MRHQHISLQDIATLAGVTKMTVSRYLRAPHQVARQTGERIARVIQEIGYSSSNGLPHTHNYTIGVLIPSFQNLLFADLLAGIESVTSINNYQVLIANYNYFQDSEEKQLIHLLSCHINGIILCEKDHSIRTVKYLRAANIPIVEVMDTQGNKLDMQVGFNNSKAAFDMVNRMLEKRPHRNIIYMGSKDDSRDKQRFTGYRAAMQHAGLATLHINPQSISSIQLGGQLIHQALQQYKDIDGVFCSNDDLAMGVLLYCQQQKIAVPEKIAIAGFHGLKLDVNSPGSQAIQLASVITPRFEIGCLAARLLIKKIVKVNLTTDNIVNIDHADNDNIDVGYQIYAGDTL